MAKHFEHWIDRGEASREQFFGLLQTGLDLLNQGLTVFNHDLELVAWNQTFFTLLEFPRQFARVGTPFEEFLRYNAQRGEYGEGDVEAAVSERLGWARTFKPHYAERVRPSGMVIAVRGEPLPGKGFITLYTDITAQRRFEQMLREQNQLLEARVQERTRDLQASAEALRSSENRLRVITDAIPALIAYCDRDRRYRFVNAGYARWFGMTKEAMVGRPTREVVGEALYAQVSPHTDRLFATRKPVAYEYSRVREGRTEYARSTLIPELDETGAVIGFFVLSQDITEQRRTRAVLAHDVDHLLASVIGDLQGPALDAARERVELVRRLLLQPDERALEAAPTNAGAVVARLAPLLRRAMPDSVRLDVETPDAPIWAHVDAAALESALLELALNARDAMPQGGTLRVRVTVALVDAREGQELELKPGAYAKLAFSDTGGGAMPDLATIDTFARRSQGALRIASTPGLGTTVALWLRGAEAPA